MHHQAMPLLTGRSLGDAIRSAIKVAGWTQRAVADRYQVKPQSVQGWLNTGNIAKDKLFALLDDLRDAVGPEHWGLKTYPPEIEAMRAHVAPEATPKDYMAAPALRAALDVLHEHMQRAAPAIRAEVQENFALYSKEPRRYLEQKKIIGDLLLGEIESATPISQTGKR